MDETGEKFTELIDHQALVPDPQLNNLTDFEPAIIASRGWVQAVDPMSEGRAVAQAYQLEQLRQRGL
jgi:hypothetical protein